MFSYFYDFCLQSHVIGKNLILSEPISLSLYVKMASKQTLVDFGFSSGTKRPREGQATSPSVEGFGEAGEVLMKARGFIKRA